MSTIRKRRMGRKSPANYIPRLLALWAGTCLFLSICFSQNKITGIVVDSETTQPISDAVVYFGNSFYGTSTNLKGEFTIPSIPNGDFELIVSRVGYLPYKEFIHFGTDQIRDTLIKLIADPVFLNETTARMGGETDRLPSRLFPSSADNCYCLYGIDSTLPIGILIASKILYMYAIEPIRLDSEYYLRVWALVFNSNDTPIVMDLKNDILLNIIKPHSAYNSLHPIPIVDAGADNRDTSLLTVLNTKVGRTLEGISEQRSIFLHAADRFDFLMGGRPWSGENAPPDYVAGINPLNLFRIFNKCEYVTRLAKYRIFPKCGVQGFLHYLIPGFISQQDLRIFYSYKYSISISSQTGSLNVDFKTN